MHVRVACETFAEASRNKIKSTARNILSTEIGGEILQEDLLSR